MGHCHVNKSVSSDKIILQAVASTELYPTEEEYYYTETYMMMI